MLSLFATNRIAVIGILPLVCQKYNCLHYVTVNLMLLSFFLFFFVDLKKKKKKKKKFYLSFFPLLSPASRFLWREGVKRKKLNPSIEQEVDQSGAFFLIFLCVKNPTVLLMLNDLSKTNSQTQINLWFDFHRTLTVNLLMLRWFSSYQGIYLSLRQSDILLSSC